MSSWLELPEVPPPISRLIVSTASTSPLPLLHHLFYLTFPDALAGAPFAPCLLTILPACPLAAPAALFAFSDFFLLSASAFFSLPALIASWRAAVRASGRWERRSLITSREAPTMPRCCLTVRRVRFLATSYWSESMISIWTCWLYSSLLWCCHAYRMHRSWDRLSLQAGSPTPQADAAIAFILHRLGPRNSKSLRTQCHSLR